MFYELDGRTPETVGEVGFVAHNATVIGSVKLMESVSIWYNVVIRGDNDLITIGPESNVQDGAILHTDPGIPLTLGRGLPWGIRPCCTGVRLATIP